MCVCVYARGRESSSREREVRLAVRCSVVIQYLYRVVFSEEEARDGAEEERGVCCAFCSTGVFLCELRVWDRVMKMVFVRKGALF